MTLQSLRTKLGVLRRCAHVLARGRRLGVHTWLTGNPYSDMLYHGFRGVHAPQAMTLLEEMDAFTRLPSRNRLLWIHSEASYSWGRSGQDLEAAYRSYLRSLERWSRKNGRLVWTIHDEGLHLNDPNAHRIEAIRDKLRQMADCVHVHSEAARAVVVREFGIDLERVIVVPHPSYAALYDGPPTRNDEPATQDSRKRRLLCFGHVKAYKNYPALAAALEQLGRGSFARLTIAGQSSGGVALPEDDYRKNVDLDLRLRFIPDEEVPHLFGDADFMVLPYTDSLTSGAAALSMGFGLPVIAPDLGGMREAVPQENWPLIYLAKEPGGLAEALRRARDMSDAEYEELEQSCRAFGERIHPERISASLIETLSARGVLEPE